MAKESYSELASTILEAVGGADNIVFCEHCITRLRFVVKDKSLVNNDVLNKLEGTNGSLWVGDQLQVIIGTSVGSVYNEVCKKGNFNNKSEKMIAEVNNNEEKKTLKEYLKAIVTTMTECIIPVLGAFVAMGLIAAVISIVGPVGLNMVSEESGIFRLLKMMQDGILYFIPVAIAYSSAKKFNVSPIFSIMLVCIQLSSEWIATLTDGSLSILGVTPSAVTLNGQIIPVIIQIWLLSKVERRLNKIIPDNFKFFLVGTLELMIMVPIALFILTPAGFQLGYLIAYPITLLEGISPLLVSFLAAGLYNLFISVGMHSALSGIFTLDLFLKGVNYSLLPAVFSQCWVLTACNLAVFIKTNDQKLKKTSKESTIAAIVGGVMEPSIYAIYLRKIRVMIAACIGMAITGLVHRIFGVGVYAISASNFLSFTAFLAGGLDNLIKAIPGILIGSLTAFGLVFVLGIEKKNKILM